MKDVRADVFIVNVEVVIVRDGRYLMIVRGAQMAYGAGWLCMPGGKVDWIGPEQEVLEATARREVFEEVGLELDGPFAYVESHSFGSPPVLDVVLLARSIGGEAWVKAPDEVGAVEWMTIEEILVDPRAQPWTRHSMRLADERCLALGW